MSRTTRTPSTIVVTPLDLSDVETAAVEWINKHREIDGKRPVKEMEISPDWGIVETPLGMYALCTEGVGPSSPVTDDAPLVVELFIRSYEPRPEGAQDDDANFISMFAACTQKLTPDELRKRATGEPVKLEDYIRAFGSRLESNYSQWQRTLEAAFMPPKRTTNDAPRVTRRP